MTDPVSMSILAKIWSIIKPIFTYLYGVWHINGRVTELEKKFAEYEKRASEHENKLNSYAEQKSNNQPDYSPSGGFVRVDSFVFIRSDRHPRLPVCPKCYKDYPLSRMSHILYAGSKTSLYCEICKSPLGISLNKLKQLQDEAEKLING